MNFFYICSSRDDASALDGGQIHDSKLIQGLRNMGSNVVECQIKKNKSFSPPFWKSNIDCKNIYADVNRFRGLGYKIIISHEVFFGISPHIRPDAIIVHNYMPSFEFPQHRWLELYFRLGASDFFKNTFEISPIIFFNSFRDLTKAEIDFPDHSIKFHYLPVPPNRVFVDGFDVNCVQLSGTTGWLPKRLSSLSISDLAHFDHNGFELRDFSDPDKSSFGLINDRFSIGIKLKMVQMIYLGSVIASMCDISDEMNKLAPRYPFYRQVTSAAEAVSWFSYLRAEHQIGNIDVFSKTSKYRQSLPSWNDMANHVVNVFLSYQRGKSVGH